MRLFHGIALAVVLAPTIVAAQTTTFDGVQAFLRGDYEAAARILTPLAEDVSHPDPIAQFFLASLYDSGRGVARNQRRACSLYASAASAATPLTPQALDIVQTIGESWAAAPAAAAVCAPANTLPWGEASPASFTLGAGHWIRLDAASTTIGFEGAEHRTVASRSGPGIVFLPIQYTPVDASSPVAMRRHFIQSFIWHRNSPADLSTWSLGWILDEVVGGELFIVTGDPQLITTTAPQPPSAIDTSRLVEVRANATGEVEWRIKDPANPRGAVIPRNGGR
jgi:hypothetical protein